VVTKRHISVKNWDIQKFMPGMGKNLHSEGQASKVALRFCHYLLFVLRPLFRIKIKKKK
jgi:hypothetical protein